jgi:hypothetical protein
MIVELRIVVRRILDVFLCLDHPVVFVKLVFLKGIESVEVWKGLLYFAACPITQWQSWTCRRPVLLCLFFFQTSMNARQNNMTVIRTRGVLIQNQDINVSANLDLNSTIMEENVKVCFPK